MKKARSRDALILDLRGNSGGYVTTLKRLVGHFFESDTKIGERMSGIPLKQAALQNL